MMSRREPQRGAYEASKQDEPRDEPRDGTKNGPSGETPTRGMIRRGGKQPTPTTGDCVFVSTCRERDENDGTEAV